MFKAAATMLALGLSSTVFASTGTGPDRDPIGEFADYKVDRNSSRTTSMIQSGTMKAEVTNFIPDHADGPSYEARIDYTFKIQMMGTRTGTEIVTVPEVYFTPEFMQDLRTNGSYVSDSFKVQHQGYADVRTMDGGVYPHCDKIRIYDVQSEIAATVPMINVARQLLGPTGQQPDGDFEDMEIIAHIKEGLPVLGAAKIDVSGLYQNMRVKAGADYERP
jgi:hypothetical protein